MPAEQSTASEAPSVAIGKTASSRKARQDSVGSMQTDDYCVHCAFHPALQGNRIYEPGRRRMCDRLRRRWVGSGYFYRARSFD